VRQAKRSVVFCLFSSTDDKLRDACFDAADDGRTMFGLVNRVSTPKEGSKETATTRATVALYHRSRKNRDVYGFDYFRRGREPSGFWWEIPTLKTVLDKATKSAAKDEDGKREPPEVYVHHKFVVIDAETDSPIIYTGSANFSNNSNYRNDENLLEVRNAPRLARAYLAEFLRLYEHYRARTQFGRRKPAGRGKRETLKLCGTKDEWARKYYRFGSPEYKSRLSMAGDA